MFPSLIVQVIVFIEKNIQYISFHEIWYVKICSEFNWLCMHWFTSFHKCAILWAVNLLHMYIFHN